MNAQHEKQASVGLAAAGALGGHVLTNLFLRRKFNDPRFLADVFRAGYHHGMQGKQVSSLRSGLFRRIAGPEIPEMYNYARYSGAVDRVRRSLPDVFQQMMSLPPEQHEAFLSRLGKSVRKRPEIRDLLHAAGSSQATGYAGGAAGLLSKYREMRTPTPQEVRPLRVAMATARREMPAVGKAVLMAQRREKLNRPMGLVGRYFAGDRPQFMQRMGMAPRAVTAAQPEAKGPLSIVKRIIPETAALGLSMSGLLPGASAHIVPELAGHASLNMVRDVVARTGIGRRMFGRMLAKASAGKMPPALLTDVALSPGVTEFLRSAKITGQIQRAAAPLLPQAQPPAVQPAVPAAQPMPRPVAQGQVGFVGGRYIPHSALLRRRFGPYPQPA